MVVCPILRAAAVPTNEDLHTVLILVAVTFAVIGRTDWKNPAMGFSGMLGVSLPTMICGMSSLDRTEF